MTEITKVIADILAADVPILCIDTCTLLDLIRDPSRGKFSEHDAGAAIELLTRAEAEPCAIRIILTELVEEELTNNRNDVALETETQLRKIDATIASVLKVFAVYGVRLAGSNLATVGFEKIGNKFVDRFLGVRLILAQPAGVLELAFDRVCHARAPAKRAKDSIKDCVIVESYIELVKQLRAAGFTNRAVFFTTNTVDFCISNTSDLSPDLAGDFASCGLEFAVRFGHAHHLLTRPD